MILSDKFRTDFSNQQPLFSFLFQLVLIRFEVRHIFPQGVLLLDSVQEGTELTPWSEVSSPGAAPWADRFIREIVFLDAHSINTCCL
jgi:hypothetical protein